MTPDERALMHAQEAHDRQVEIDNQVCTTCHGIGSIKAGWADDDGDMCPDCDGEGVAW